MEVLFNIENEEHFKNVMQDILDNLYSKQNNSNHTINESSIAMAKDEIKEVIFETGCNSEKVYEYMLSKGCKSERSQIFSSLVKCRKNDLLYSTLLNFNSARGETMVTFDWVVKFVYGTSELKKLKYPLLQLAFTTLNKGDRQQRTYDLNKDVLIKMINVLENYV